VGTDVDLAAVCSDAIDELGVRGVLPLANGLNAFARGKFGDLASPMESAKFGVSIESYGSGLGAKVEASP
jgi:hypothetical protein